EYLWNPARRCLPHILREAGYETVFLQAARLRFMHKDRFMPLAGFSQVIGDESFEQDMNRSRWGIDDRTLFRKAREKIGELEQSDKPWFMTILTVGTHHPYATPANCSSSFPRGTFEHAAACADQALEELLTGLEHEGILQNTIVLVTSDESGGLRQESDDLALRLSRNWGFLTVVTPEGQSRRIDEPFLQSDVALSVLDYLGIGDADHSFGGRSVFRSYKKKRPLFFGNVYHNHVVGLDVDGRLIIVDDAMQQGRAYDIGEQCLFMATRKAADFAPADREFVRLMAVRCSHDAAVSKTGETFRR
ncbi:MAG: LTA synthase family protein, partial [Planctomycetales bacterium]|nr:LTA synthase family protein [Planctomycetales bacterium]